MRVDSQANLNLSVNTTAANRPSEATPTPTTRTAEGTAPLVDSQFTQTPDLQRLLAAVKEQPDVRTELVADVKDRLVAGELQTQQAAIDTAQALLESQPN
jgi:hypothetical protein